MTSRALSRRPIGVFDSGLGGLTVVRELQQRLPAESILYLGDTARVPYGPKSPRTVRRFAVEAMAFLRRRRVKMAVIACNTVSSLALPECRRTAGAPVVGVLGPGVRAAVEATRGGRIGVLGTRATVASRAYERGIRRALPRAVVVAQACPLFVPLVEEGFLDHAVTDSVALGYLRPMQKAGVDTVVLGCTHYPLLKGVLRRVLGPRVALIDSAFETARDVEAALARSGLLRTGSGRGRATYFVTDGPETFRRVGERFLGSPLRGVRRTVLPEAAS